MGIARDRRHTALKYVRLATHEDIPVLLEFASKFHRMSPYGGLSFSHEKGSVFLKTVIEGSLRDFVCLVALNDSKPIGFLVGAANEPVFSGDRIATELGWWIEEESRGTRASMLIYAAYEDWAKRVDCVAVQGAYLPGVSTDLEKFYKKRGYHLVESSYLKRLR